MRLKSKFLILMFVLIFTSALMVACSNDSDSENGSSDAEDTNATEQTNEDRVVTVHADTINSHLVEHAVCVVNSRFEQGWHMVFRATVNDAVTGDLIEDADVRVVLEDGQEFDMVLGVHGEDAQLYTVAWTIPEDYTTGTLEYEIIATVDGEEYAYEPFDVAPSKLTIIEPETTEG